jgi:hypothetical protein
MPVLRDNQGNWLRDPANQCPGKPVPLNDEMRQMRAQWAPTPKERQRGL